METENYNFLLGMSATHLRFEKNYIKNPIKLRVAKKTCINLGLYISPEITYTFHMFYIIAMGMNINIVVYLVL